MDPPDHTRLRQLVAPAFRPALMHEYEPQTRVTAEMVLERAVSAKTFDVVRDFAYPLATHTISEMLDISPLDRERLATTGVILGRALGGVFSVRQAAEVRAALYRLEELFVRLEADRRQSPGEDLISHLVAARVEGALTMREFLDLCGLLLVAGFETTVNLITNAVGLLAGEPEYWQAMIADPRLAGRVVEETLRVDPPVAATLRVAHEPVKLGGHHIASDQPVLLILGAANRDPERYRDPDRFDPTRTGEPEHLGFGAGVHYCLGVPLARLEGRIALETLARRLPELRVAGPTPRRTGVGIRGYTRLPLGIS